MQLGVCVNVDINVLFLVHTFCGVVPDWGSEGIQPALRPNSAGGINSALVRDSSSVYVSAQAPCWMFCGGCILRPAMQRLFWPHILTTNQYANQWLLSFILFFINIGLIYCILQTVL
jgi:hypothetical protein